jgi:hypothetical protein
MSQRSFTVASALGEPRRIRLAGLVFVPGSVDAEAWHRGCCSELSEQAGVSVQGTGEGHLALYECAPPRGVPHLRLPELPVLARCAPAVCLAARPGGRQLGATGGPRCLTRTSATPAATARRLSRTPSWSRRSWAGTAIRVAALSASAIGSWTVRATPYARSAWQAIIGGPHPVPAWLRARP